MSPGTDRYRPGVPGSIATAPPFHADLARSVRLFRAFRAEQSDPERFYVELARDSVRQISSYVDLAGKTVLDVGGGPGFFRAAFEDAGCRYVALDPDAGELSSVGTPGPGTVLGSGLQLPVRSGSVDVCYSSNVLEHVSPPWELAEELVRVTKQGGLVYLSYTVWAGPWGGHETSPWHWFGGERAARRYERRQGHPPKNLFGTSLFAVTVVEGLKWSQRCPRVEVLAAIPRYAPAWARWPVRVPLMREVVTWNLLLVLRRR